MRRVEVGRPSFPEVPRDEPLPAPERERWRVVCGDEGHWRLGYYSPPESMAAEVGELERHDCPELFLLLRGRLTLVLADGDTTRELTLEEGHPVLVSAPHGGYCPDGPHTGLALVVERDAFSTEYRTPGEWLER